MAIVLDDLLDLLGVLFGALLGDLLTYVLARLTLVLITTLAIATIVGWFATS